MYNSLQFIILEFNKKLYLSSINVEAKMSEQFQLTADGNSKIPRRIFVRYSAIFFKEDTMIELVNYFIFEVQERVFSLTEFKEIDIETKRRLKQ